MKITDIKPYPIWAGGRNVMLVKVETDEGIHGWASLAFRAVSLPWKGRCGITASSLSAWTR